jgi:hypothetical protein
MFSAENILQRLVRTWKIKKKKKLGIISLTPSNFSHFCKHPPNIQKLSLTHLELSKILTYPHPYKLGTNFFKKDQNTPIFYFLKKKKNLKVGILYKSHRLKFTI